MKKSSTPPSRDTCWRCFWPRSLCWCNGIAPMQTRSKFVILMHPKEFKHVKANTGRLASICLQNSEIHMGISFDTHPRVVELTSDPKNHPMLLFPSPDALLLDSDSNACTLEFPTNKQPVFFLFDATWSCANTMAKQNPALMALPKIMFQTRQESRYTIKKQPNRYCLSTLEACHELLLSLDIAGLDTYPDTTMMISLFDRMQNHQIRSTAKNPSNVRRSKTSIER